MRIVMLSLLWIAPALMAQSPAPVDFFGPEHFAAASEDPRRGALTVSFVSEIPPFLDLNNSDPLPASNRFESTQTGLVLTAAGKGQSCEAELDAGFVHALGTLSIVELDSGASVAFHLRSLSSEATGTPPEYLLLLARDGADSGRLRLLTRTRNGFSETAAARLENHDFSAAATFSLAAGADKVEAAFGGASVQGAARLKSGFTLALAASDGRCRVRDLSLQCELHALWWQDALARLEAKRTLARLKEYTTQGLLSGVCQGSLRDEAEDLRAYPPALEQARRDALQNPDFVRRFNLLREIAAAHPKLALAQHEAGVAALLAGFSQAARDSLRAALALRSDSLTRLALAEACLRQRDFDAAGRHLEQARDGLDAKLLPDMALLSARLAAARGNMALAARDLTLARARWPEHAALAAFAASAEELVAPLGLAKWSRPGPLGLTVVSDLDDAALEKLLARLGPYIDRIRHWLPGLAQKLEGSIAVYSTPTGYLRAALLVAGESLDNVAGMFLPAGIGGGPSVVACRAFGEDELARTLVHELWHLAVYSLKGSAMAPWLNEGMAVYLSAGQADKDGTLRFVRLPSEFSRMSEQLVEALSDPQAARRALGAGLDSFYSPDVQRMNYALAWALVWYHCEHSVAQENVLRGLLAGDAATLAQLQEGLPALLAAMVRALKERKLA
ncbi:hypothetical protein EDM80_04165 [bacterium]|nr:MAG: hypothetical protein EDM80_04165 [bacterium]RIK63557.1 MAG: hypothetical protein DCC64_06855 [Planctomycetota bacterium]